MVGQENGRGEGLARGCRGAQDLRQFDRSQRNAKHIAYQLVSAARHLPSVQPPPRRIAAHPTRQRAETDRGSSEPLQNK
jgi:hypothetical protein